ncbi:MAG TPA: cysteine--tRNA ligase, partial [Candidatus Portnoybacteria bacterium]|nr:cysteine--tRNA ligase [Candidatus Portnoybacteria bacterium]
NITDVDDKTIRDSQKKYSNLESMDALKKLTQFYEEAFWQDLSLLNVEKPDFAPRATETINEIQKIIRLIFQNGFAYEKDGSIYFDLKKYLKKYKYGRLVNLDFSQMKFGQRVDYDEYKKENIEDFALWKKRKDNEPFWDFDFQGKNLLGRPGWHIECSAMSYQYLGFPFDIHTGGVDLKFPHHENEIAQNTAAFGIEKPINFFLHNEHILVDDQKMSKSLGNFYTLRDLENRKFSPLDYRYLCLSSHYRSKMNFTWLALESARNSLNEIKNFIKRNYQESFEEIYKESNYQKMFFETISNDLNTPEALAVIWQMIKDKKLPTGEKIKLLSDFDQVLGLGLRSLKSENIPDEIKKLALKREKYRQEKNWNKADEIRKEIEKKGYLIEDTEKGNRVIENS